MPAEDMHRNMALGRDVGRHQGVFLAQRMSRNRHDFEQATRRLRQLRDPFPQHVVQPDVPAARSDSALPVLCRMRLAKAPRK